MELSLVVNVRERTIALEGRVSLIEADLNPLKREMRAIREQMVNFQMNIDEMKNRMQRKNVRIVGLPEQSEGSDPTVFLENRFKYLFGEHSFSSFFALERAHRVPSRPPQPVSCWLYGFLRRAR